MPPASPNLLNKLVFPSLGLIFIFTLVSFFTSWGAAGRYLTSFAITISALGLLEKLIHDNRHLRVSGSELALIFRKTFIIWLPFAILLIPGVLLTQFVDKQLNACVASLSAHAADKIKEVRTFQEEKRVKPFDWTSPSTWLGNAYEKTMVPYVVKITEKASLTTRIFCAFLYACLRALQYIYYSSLALVIIRSFGYVLARAAVRCNCRRFTLPNAS